MVGLHQPHPPSGEVPPHKKPYIKVSTVCIMLDN